MKPVVALIILSSLVKPLGAEVPQYLELPTQNLAYPALEWDALFDRTSGWTGADGIYSIPLSGDERPGSAGATSTFFTFSDTFIGEVDRNDQRLPGSTLIHNTNALLTGAEPDPAHIQFFWRTTRKGGPQPVVMPTNARKTNEWFWPQDGVVVGGNLYLYSLRLMMTGDPIFNFAVNGVSLLVSPADEVPAFNRYRQSETPLYLPKDGSHGEITYGMAIFPNTETAGALNPDGYLYIYGVRNDAVKKLLVARVLPQQIAQFSRYEFWTGTAWSKSISAAVPVADRISSEFSVSPLPDGRYILVFQLDTLSNKVAVRYADSPVGPWSDYSVVYTAPETDISPNVFTYNAKAHPHLSNPDRLLISYNVNTFDFVENFTNADIYRPRFIWLPLD
jgi:hypothetical protein